MNVDITNPQMIKRGDEVNVVGSSTKGIVIGYTQENGYEQCAVFLYNDNLQFCHRIMYYSYNYLQRTGNHIDLDKYYTESTIPAPNNKTEGYAYGNYHFIPHAKIGEIKSISDVILRTDFELGYFDSNDYPGRKQKYPYDYQKFYDAMNNSDLDIFKCVENGKLYVPCEHELFLYEGLRIKIDNTSKTKENDEQDFDKIYGSCQFRDCEGNCYFDKSQEDIDNDNINLCDNICEKKKVCKIF